MLIQSTPSRPNSQSTINKLLQKDLKQLIFSLQSSQLINLFKNLQLETQIASSKQFIKIGLKCSQCHTIFDTFQSKGYGRDQHEALINSIKIILESMIASSYRIQSIKKALKYCSKFKQPLINSSQSQASNLMSSMKKSTKKVQGMETIKMNKKHLEYGNYQQTSNKQNVSRKINETLDLSNQNQKIIIDTHQIKLSTNENKFGLSDIKLGNEIRLCQKYQKGYEQRQPSPVLQNSQIKSKQQNNQKKCTQIQNGKQCIYLVMHKHSQKQIKNLNARIKLLQEENQMLKQLLLKDFDKTLFNKKQKIQTIRP